MPWRIGDITAAALVLLHIEHGLDDLITPLLGKVTEIPTRRAPPRAGGRCGRAALRRRGWTISAIAWHLGHERKTVRADLSGDRVAGQRRRAEPEAKPTVPRVRPIASWLLRHPDELDTEEQLQLKQVLAACPHLHDTATPVVALRPHAHRPPR